MYEQEREADYLRAKQRAAKNKNRLYKAYVRLARAYQRRHGQGAIPALLDAFRQECNEGSLYGWSRLTYAYWFAARYLIELRRSTETCAR